MGQGQTRQTPGNESISTESGCGVNEAISVSSNTSQNCVSDVAATSIDVAVSETAPITVAVTETALIVAAASKTASIAATVPETAPIVAAVPETASIAAVVPKTILIAAEPVAPEPPSNEVIFNDATFSGQFLKILYDGIQNYLSTTNFSIISFHGSTGKIRANKLISYITFVNSSEIIENVKVNASWILLNAIILSGSHSMKDKVTDSLIDKDPFKSSYKNELSTLSYLKNDSNPPRDKAIDLMIRANLPSDPESLTHIIVSDVNNTKVENISSETAILLINFN